MACKLSGNGLAFLQDAETIASQLHQNFGARMLISEYLRAPLDPVGAMIVMGVDYKAYRKLTEDGFLGRVPGAKQFFLSTLQYHSFWDIVLCEARIHFNNFQQVDERFVDQVIDEIALDLEYLEPENWDDFFDIILNGPPDGLPIQQSSISAVKVICFVNQIVQTVAKSFMAYLEMLQDDLEGV